MRAFKLLAHNDTSKAKGHQAGPLIPKSIASYFPALPPEVTPLNPTVDEPIVAQLWLDSTHLGDVTTRYQHQTWGAERSPERRLTGNLARLLQHAEKDDLLIFEQQTSGANHFRLTLHKLGSPNYAAFVAGITGRWGIVI